MLQNKNMVELINIAMRKVSTPTLRAGLLNNVSFSEALQYLENYQAIAFMNFVKGTPAYWKS